MAGKICPRCHRAGYNGEHCFKCGYIEKGNGNGNNTNTEQPAEAGNRINTGSTTSSEAANALLAKLKQNSIKTKTSNNNAGRQQNGQMTTETSVPAANQSDSPDTTTTPAAPAQKPVPAVPARQPQKTQATVSSENKQSQETQTGDPRLAQLQRYYKKTTLKQAGVKKDSSVKPPEVPRNIFATQKPPVKPTGTPVQTQKTVKKPTVSDKPVTAPTEIENENIKENEGTNSSEGYGSIEDTSTVTPSSPTANEQETEKSEEDSLFDSMFHPKDPDAKDPEKAEKKKGGLLKFGKKEKAEAKEKENEERLANAYNQNEDHYYDDTQPYYEAEKQKFTLEDALKIVGSILVVIILIVFLIFYL